MLRSRTVGRNPQNSRFDELLRNDIFILHMMIPLLGFNNLLLHPDMSGWTYHVRHPLYLNFVLEAERCDQRILHEGLDRPHSKMQPAAPDGVRVRLRAAIPLKMSSFRVARTNAKIFRQKHLGFPKFTQVRNSLRDIGTTNEYMR